MELMGRYAAANHALIHRHVARALGVEVLLDVENHHNFAWRERHRLPDGSEAELIVHRKGATPAGAGVLGDHSRFDGHARLRRARQGRRGVVELRVARRGPPHEPHARRRSMFKWDAAQNFLRERRVTLLSAGLDEVPMAYKDIDEVMAAQSDLVETAGAVRAAARQDGAKRRAAGGLGVTARGYGSLFAVRGLPGHTTIGFMYTTLLAFHSWLRWAVLIAALIAAVRGVSGVVGKRRWTRSDDRAGFWFVNLLDLQMLLGLVNVLFLEPHHEGSVAELRRCHGQLRPALLGRGARVRNGRRHRTRTRRPRSNEKAQG